LVLTVNVSRVRVEKKNQRFLITTLVSSNCSIYTQINILTSDILVSVQSGSNCVFNSFLDVLRIATKS
jgi:hypothetical protein